MRALSAVLLVCWLVLITQACEGAAAGVCPSPQKLDEILVCWDAFGRIPSCSAPWDNEQVEHCSDLRIAAYFKGLDLRAAILAHANRCVVPMLKVPGELSYAVPIVINRATGIFAIIDTGFTGDLAVPRNQVDGLRAKGSLTTGDRRAPSVIGKLADGSETIQETIIIREVILPDCRAFRNIHAMVTPTGADALIGQGILSKFSSTAIDHKKHSLVLVPKGLPP